MLSQKPTPDTILLDPYDTNPIIVMEDNVNQVMIFCIIFVGLVTLSIHIARK